MSCAGRSRGTAERDVIGLDLRRQSDVTNRDAGPSVGRDISWSNQAGTFVGVGRHGGAWRISPTLAGWRLEFRDADSAWVCVGTYWTLHEAERAANRM